MSHQQVARACVDHGDHEPTPTPGRVHTAALTDEFGFLKSLPELSPASFAGLCRLTDWRRMPARACGVGAKTAAPLLTDARRPATAPCNRSPSCTDFRLSAMMPRARRAPHLARAGDG